MRFSWDETKRSVNLDKHRLDLVDARRLFDGRALFTYPSPRDGEARFVSVGLIEDRFVAVVWLERVDEIRLISLRRARDAERKVYQTLHG